MKVIFDYHLTTLSPGQRAIFALIIVLLLIFAVLGNVGTFFVNVKRKIRPLFRACLISLACSDLVTAILTSVTYLTQFSAEFIQIWHLGEIMCGLVPFLTTAGILVNSMTLVGIAIDRYMAVMRMVTGTWEPSGVLSGTCIILIWGLSAGIASPMISSYTAKDIYIILTSRNNSTIIIEGLMPVKMCGSDKNDNSYYYVIVFTIVFLPMLATFLWLNGVIAREIWIRRRAMRNFSCNPPKMEQTRIQKLSNSTGIQGLVYYTKGNQSFAPSSKPSKPLQEKHKTTTREIRQLRMFYVIFLLMLVFILCRLPTWIYLIMKLYGNYIDAVHWILHFSFGALSLTSCVLNPLLYTFLTGTIQYTIALVRRIRVCCNWRRRFYGNDSSMTDSVPVSDKGEIYTIFSDK